MSFLWRLARNHIFYNSKEGKSTLLGFKGKIYRIFSWRKDKALSKVTLSNKLVIASLLVKDHL